MKSVDERSRHFTLLQAVLLPQLPLWVCTFLGMAGAIWYIGAVDSLAYDLNEMLHNGVLSPQDLNRLTSEMRWAWLVGLMIMVGSGALASVLVMLSHRVFSRRVLFLVEYAERRAAGQEVAPLRVVGDDPFSKLERAIMHIAATVHERDEALRHEIELSHFDSEFQRALDMTDTESETLDLVELSLQMIVPGVGAELLLANSGDSELQRMATSTDAPPPGCPVNSPKACSAIRRGQTLRFSSSEALDACPRLRAHDNRPCGAICTPLNVMGHSIGVLHLTTDPGELLDDRAVDLLEVLASKTGARLGMLRTLASTQLQAQTDPLTGLLNRRSFEAEVAQRLNQGQKKHVVVLADLDHFKQLNDTEGHEAGDNALRLFAEVMRQSLRPRDVIGRHGGEEFVIFLEDCQEEFAGEVLGRLQGKLRDAVDASGSPPFTASFGMATCPRDGDTLPALLRKADRALYEAKRRGRNCAVHFSELSAAPGAVGKVTLQLPEEEAVLLTVHQKHQMEHVHSLDASL